MGDRRRVPRSIGGYHHRGNMRRRHLVPQNHRIYVRETCAGGPQSPTDSRCSEQTSLFGLGFVAMGSWRVFPRPSSQGPAQVFRGSSRGTCQVPVGGWRRDWRLSCFRGRKSWSRLSSYLRLFFSSASVVCSISAPALVPESSCIVRASVYKHNLMNGIKKKKVSCRSWYLLYMVAACVVACSDHGDEISAFPLQRL